jgi:small subunit ribosomal protein S19
MKIPFVDYKLYTAVLNNESILATDLKQANESVTVSLTKSRSSTIVSNFVNRIISVYNGKTFKRIKIKENMIGHKLGEFVLTKNLGSSIHNSEKNRKKKEKMRRKITQRKVRKPTAVKAPVKK